MNPEGEPIEGQRDSKALGAEMAELADIAAARAKQDALDRAATNPEPKETDQLDYLDAEARAQAAREAIDKHGEAA